MLTYTLDVSNPGAAFTADVTDVVPDGHVVRRHRHVLARLHVRRRDRVVDRRRDRPRHDDLLVRRDRDRRRAARRWTTPATLDPTSPNLDPIAEQPGPDRDRPQPRDRQAQFARPARSRTATVITYTLFVSNESDVNATSVVVSRSRAGRDVIRRLELHDAGRASAAA